MDIVNWKATLCISGSIFCGLAYKFIRKNTGNKPLESTLNEVLLYGSKDAKKTKEIGLDNLFCIYYVIAHATRTVDVCVPALESETITRCLVNVRKNNEAKVRIAIHNSNHFDNLNTFTENGIEVKVINPEQRLEHEFVLVDACEDFEDSLAVIGSLDYDTTRVNCNKDITLLTSERTVVIALKQEFDRVWSCNQDIKRE